MKRKPYPKYKDSGIEWLGMVPEHWEVKRLKYLCNIVTGNTPTKSNDDHYSNEGFLWVKPDNLDGFNPIIETKDYLTSQGLQLARIIPAFSPFVCCIGTIGKFGYSEFEVATNQQINSIIFNKTINNRFGLYFISSSEKEQARYANKNVVSILNSENQSQISFAFPAIFEQKAIASYLDKETGRIDELIGKNERLIELLKEKRTALISHIVTKGLNPNVPMKDSGIDWLGDVPKHWEVKRLKSIVCEPLKYGANEPAILEDIELPRFIRITDVDESGNLREDTFKSLPEEVAEPFLLEIGDILLARSGATVGKSFIYKESWGKAAFAGYLIKASISKSVAVAQFIYLYTRTTYYSQWIASIQIQATIQNVSADKYASLPCPVPPIKEQIELVAFLNTECGKIDTLIGKVESLIERLKEYRTTLINDAVTGKFMCEGV